MFNMVTLEKEVAILKAVEHPHCMRLYGASTRRQLKRFLVSDVCAKDPSGALFY